MKYELRMSIGKHKESVILETENKDSLGALVDAAMLDFAEFIGDFHGASSKKDIEVTIDSLTKVNVDFY